MKQLFERLSELTPILTGELSLCRLSLDELNGIRSIVFDVYGTLLVSDSGDIGNTNHLPQYAAEALKEVLLYLEISLYG